MLGLGDLAGDIFASNAEGVSANGSVAVGMSVSDSGVEAFRGHRSKERSIGFL